MKQQQKRMLHIFCDFDGTIALEDLGDKIFADCGADFENLQNQLIHNELNVPDYWRKLVASLPRHVGREEIMRRAMQEEIDVNFRSLVEFSQEHNFPLTVVSDGFEEYILPIFQRENLNSVKLFCNKLVLNEFQQLVPNFPYQAEGCSCFCASCKRNTLLQLAHPEHIIVYIGDGGSDFCPAEHADIVFAKKALLRYCSVEKIPHYPFKNLFEVVRILEKIVRENSAKPRHQAHLRRMSAFVAE